MALNKPAVFKSNIKKMTKLSSLNKNRKKDFTK